jgi:pimeloyl-ACP methyl ester carboxylesterase
MIQQKDFLFNRNKVCYYTGGQGAAVVLLHGFGEDSSIWKNQVELLSTRYRLIIPDIPGSGYSAPLQNNPAIEDFAEVIKHILDKENINSCTMLGHSMGGYIALAFAEKYPAWLTGLGLLHSTAFADSAEKKIARAKSIDFIQANGAYAFLKTAIPGLFCNTFISTNTPVVEELVQKAVLFTDNALIDYYDAMILRQDRSILLKSLKKPVLLIAGVHDNAVPFAQSMQHFPLPAQAHIHILRHSAHMGMLEEPAVFTRAIESFLASIIP